MKHTATKLLRALCGMAVMLALVAGIASVPALALSNGIYLATATPHYRHPTTGVIEDSGGEENAVLGQSMTESATYNKALVEVDPQGNTYVTVRLQLMDNIKEPQFQVDGKTVTATLMQENYGSLSAENTADYRMKVNSENSVIRCNMFVVAMGREVIFYITVGGLQSGSGDFIPGVKVETPSTPTAGTSKSETSSGRSTPSGAESTPQESGVPESSAPQTTASENAGTDAPDTKDTKKETESNDSAMGLQEFDKSGNKVSDEKENSSGEAEKQSGSVALWIIGGALLVVIAGVCIWYFAFYRKKKIGRQRQ